MGKSNNGNTEAASIIGRFKGAFSSVATEVTKAVTEALAAPKSAAEINAEEALLAELKNSTTKISRLTEILSRTRNAGKPLEERMKYVEAILTSRPVLSLEQIAAIDKSAKSEFEYFSDGDLEGVFNRASKLFQSKTTEYAMEYSIMSANRPALNIINLLAQKNLDIKSQSIIYEGLRKREDDIKKAFSNLSTMELEGYVDRFRDSFNDIAVFAGKVKNEKEVDNLIIEETKAKAAREAEIAAAKEAEIKAALEKQKKNR